MCSEEPEISAKALKFIYAKCFFLSYKLRQLMIDAASFNMGSGSYSHDLSVSENRILPASLRLTSMLLQELLPDSFRFWGSRMFVLFNSTIW